MIGYCRVSLSMQRYRKHFPDCAKSLGRNPERRECNADNMRQELRNITGYNSILERNVMVMNTEYCVKIYLTLFKNMSIL